jgi:hypothetical protein
MIPYRYFASMFLMPILMFSMTKTFGQNNQLNIYSPYGVEFTLHLDGDCKSNSPQTWIKVPGLDKARYNIKLNFKNNKAEDFKSTVYLSENGMHAAGREFNFQIVPFMGGGYTLQLVSIFPAGSGQYGNTPVPGYPGNIPQFPSYPGSIPVYPGSVPVYPGTYPGYPSQQNGYNINYIPMREEEFEKAKRLVRFKALDKDKLVVARQVVAANYLESSQLCALMKVFTYDDNKLELAKYAYERTIDKGNFYLVNEAFSFNTTADELNKFLLQRYAGR